MKLILVTTLLSVVLTGAETRGASPAVLGFEEVLERAVSRATAEDARVEMTRDNVKLLESLGKSRLEFRPILGLLAYTNPVLLATSIGTGLLINRRTAPSAAALESARFDALASELQANATRIRARIEAARLYFELLEKQDMSDRAEAALAQRKQRAGEVERQLRSASITAFDQIAFEQELLDLEAQVLEAGAQRKYTAARLALLIGAGEHDVRLEEVDLYGGAWERPAPALETLLASARERRGELRAIRGKIESLRAEAGTGRGTRTGDGPGTRMAGTLLGSPGDLAVAIPGRDTGEKAAETALRHARVRLLESELKAIEDTVRAEITALETQAAAGLERVRLSTRKLELVRKAYEAVELRVKAGLTQPAALGQAERAVLDAHWNRARSVNERKASVFVLYTLAGMDQETAAAEARQKTLHAVEAGGR